MLNQNEKQQRWTDEMLDNLASNVSEVKDTVIETRKSMDILNVTIQDRRMKRFEKEMEQRKEESKKWEREQAETNKRFDVLLGEIRYLIRNIRPEDKSEN